MSLEPTYITSLQSQYEQEFQVQKYSQGYGVASYGVKWGLDQQGKKNPVFHP